MTDLNLSNVKFELEAARRIVGELADLIRQECDRLEVGGSVRRGEAMVKDAELIAIPNHPYFHIKTGKPNGSTLWDELDSLLERGVIEKALYGEKKSPRWDGALYRGLLLNSMKVEIFLADHENYGYQKFLRTGPGESNHYIMGYLIRSHAPVRFVGSYAWFSPENLWRQVKQGSKDVWVANDQQKLTVAEEETVFTLLGMPYLPPNERSIQRYKGFLDWNRKHQWPDFRPYIYVPPMQENEALFNIPAVTKVPKEKAAKAGTQVADGETPTYISPFSVTEANAADWNRQVYRETLARLTRQRNYYIAYAGSHVSYEQHAQRLTREIENLIALFEGD